MSDEHDVDIDDEIDGNTIGDDELPPTTAQQVLEYLAKSVVSDPDAVDIYVDDRGRRVRLTVRVGDGDMGRVIGRRGRIANSIRTIVRAAASSDDVQVEVEFED